MPEKPKQQPKKPTVEGLKGQKASIAKDYKKFEGIKERYTTEEGLTQSLGITKALWKKIAKKPKFAAIADKVKLLAFNGLSALMAIKGISISKESNLIKIKKKLKGLKNKLQSTYKNWITKHGELVRMADVEKKRFELLSSYKINSLDQFVTEAIETTLIDTTVDDIDATIKELTNTITSSSLYLNLRKKIETASADEILHMYSDPSRFADFEKNLHELTIAEYKKSQLLKLIQEATEMGSSMINFINTEEDTYNAHQEIIGSDEYMKLIEKIHTSSYADLVKIEQDKDFSRKYTEKFQLIGYRYINTKRLNKQLTPYLKLKPKGTTNEQFLATLQNNKIYKTALAQINSGTLEAQKNFDSSQYIDFSKEKETKQPRGKAPENMYQFALFAAQIVPNNSLANGKTNKDFDLA